MSKSKKSIALGHVIRILDIYTLIVDVGSPLLSVGDEIQVCEFGDSILDLNGNELSKFIFVKDTLEVTDVQEHYSICKKNKTIAHRVPTMAALSPLLEFTSTERVPLSVDDSEIHPLNSFDSKIHVGDLIKLA
jgi:hypothetical protein